MTDHPLYRMWLDRHQREVAREEQRRRFEQAQIDMLNAMFEPPDWSGWWRRLTARFRRAAA